MKNIGAIALATLLTPLAASAQSVTWDQKGYVSFYLGGQVKTDTVDTSSAFTVYDEAGSVNFRQEYGGGFAFLVGGGARVWSNLVIGGAVSHTSSDQTVTGAALVPHPLFYNQPRSATVDAGGYEHSETAFHVQAKWMIPASDRFDVGVFGGPSFVNLSHDFASAPVTITEAGFPYSSVSVSDPGVTNKGKTVVGVNIGAEATYRVTTQLGVGGMLMYSAATAKMDVDGVEREIKGGGLLLGVGARVSF